MVIAEAIRRSVSERRQCLHLYLWMITPIVLVFIGLFLRVYRFESLGWVPDTYIQLEDASRIARGELPTSIAAPPGVAVLIAPFFLLLPDTLMTMQVVITGCGISLIGVAYAGSYRVARDRLAAGLFAFVVATAPMFVYFSRDALFDIIVTLLVAMALLSVPAVRSRSLAVSVAYGVLLAILINIRMTNLFVLPVILIYWFELASRKNNILRLPRAFVEPRIVTIFSVIAVLTVSSIVLGNWFGNARTVPLTTESYIDNVLYYVGILASVPLGTSFLVPLTIAGSFRLWRINSSLCLAVFVLLALWPLAHSPFHFTAYRYMLPAFFFVFFLGTLGVRELWGWAWKQSVWLGLVLRGFTAICLVFFLAQFLVSSGTILHRWPRIADQSDEGMLRDLRPVLAELPGTSLLVSAVSTGLEENDSDLRFLDLIDESLEPGSDEEHIRRVRSTISNALADGTNVFYLYTRWEAGEDFQGNGRDGYRKYFDIVSDEFSIILFYEVPWLNLNEFPWIIYKVQELNER